MKKLTGQFRSTTWDPFLIICQIISLQCIMYFGLGLWIFLVDLLAGSSRSLDHLFKYQEIHIHDFDGKLIITAFVLNALTSALGLWFVVQRTKQCLDFSATMHLFHLLACWGYNGHFPASPLWWLLNGACLTITCVCAEFLCMRTELQAIPLSLGPKADL
ncbi:protein SYS1 homolog [Bacillus rossius redtenbacheri]|uniref:protein SYS1 homolog n=1 Tax=Bacillus rossius redtenbacheri TaxID=93214 RepID=UPI002FDD2D3B